MSDQNPRSGRTGRNPCEVCGYALGNSHGNRRYHPGVCAETARKARQRHNQAAYRARLSGAQQPQVPDDFTSGRVTVKGRILPGEASAAIRTAAMPPLMAALAFHDALREVPYSDVLNNEQLNRLRGFVDDVLTLVEVINDKIPVADIDSERVHASSGLEIVRTLHLNQPRPGAPKRRR